MTYNDKCSTCGGKYSKSSRTRGNICSNGFHCCRDCVWQRGKIIEMCEECAIETLTNKLEWELMKNEKGN